MSSRQDNFPGNHQEDGSICIARETFSIILITRLIVLSTCSSAFLRILSPVCDWSTVNQDFERDVDPPGGEYARRMCVGRPQHLRRQFPPVGYARRR